jgi:hypothetical protein
VFRIPAQIGKQVLYTVSFSTSLFWALCQGSVCTRLSSCRLLLYVTRLTSYEDFPFGILQANPRHGLAAMSLASTILAKVMCRPIFVNLRSLHGQTDISDFMMCQSFGGSADILATASNVVVGAGSQCLVHPTRAWGKSDRRHRDAQEGSRPHPEQQVALNRPAGTFLGEPEPTDEPGLVESP